MFGWLKGKSSTPTLNDFNDIKKLIDAQGMAKAGETVRKAADAGNLVCQNFMSQLGLYLPPEMRTGQVERDTEHYLKLAAENGDPDSQFNLALMHIKRVKIVDGYTTAEGAEHLRQAKHWYRKAAAQGFQPAIENLKDLEDFPD